jgi:hypothetical protein
MKNQEQCVEAWHCVSLEMKPFARITPHKFLTDLAVESITKSASG